MGSYGGWDQWINQWQKQGTTGAKPASSTTTAAGPRTITAPSTWEGLNGSTLQGGHNESQLVEAINAKYGNTQYAPVYVMHNGALEEHNGQKGYWVKFRDNGLGGVSTTEFVPIDGFQGGNLSGGGGPGGGGPGGGGGTGIIPGAGIYRQYQAEAKLAYDQALARIRQQRGTLMQQYGFTADVDEKTGMHNNVRLDPYNQFGQVRTMLARQGLSLDDVRSNAIGRHISGGLGRQGERNLRFLHGAESQALGNQFSQQMAELLGLQQDSEARYRKALLDAELEALRTALANQAFRPGSNGSNSSSSTSAAPPVPKEFPLLPGQFADGFESFADYPDELRAATVQNYLGYGPDQAAYELEQRRKRGRVY